VNLPLALTCLYMGEEEEEEEDVKRQIKNTTDISA
jgi:hypothetical protein